MTQVAAGPDWASRVRATLAGSHPRHEPHAWVVPGVAAGNTPGLRPYLPTQPTPAAVLVPLIERPQMTVLLTQRATRLRHHAGQISFPGGRIEPDDADPCAAALREAQEEIGLDSSFISVVGYLPDHVVITGFRVTPVVALVRPGFRLLLDMEEVSETFELPLDSAFDPANHRISRRRSGFTGEEGDFCDILWQGHNIWGATAGMLLTLQRVLQGSSP